ncbi:MAG TPA: ComF family protein [Rhizomicrobium sp.]|nr:ComF family protein [Rhizomicrobium sp.]
MGARLIAITPCHASLPHMMALGNPGAAVLDLLFPPLCMACRLPVAAPGLCAACWSGIAFLEGPACTCCGLPFPVDLGEGNFCAACLARPPAFDSARAILAYDEKSRGAILALKHADRLDLVPGFAHWLARAGRSALSRCELIVPVPLHRLRLWRRRYNQAAELARRLGHEQGIDVDPGALVRTRPTQSQGAMASARARRRNVLGAFKVPDPASVAGRRVLLVDDVMTTGATVEACARALRRAGAAEVHVLALARVVRATDMPI